MSILFHIKSHLTIVGFVSVVALTGLACTISTPAHADNGQVNFSADELVEACSSQDAQDLLICMVYTRGVLDGLDISQQTVCVGYDVSAGALATRIVRAALQFTIEGLADEVLLGLPDRDLTKVRAADFVRWAFISAFEGENPTDFRCSN